MNYLVDSFFSISLFGFIFTTAFLIRRKPLAYYFFISVYFIYVTSLFVNLAMANGLIDRLPHLYRIVSPLVKPMLISIPAIILQEKHLVMLF